MILLILSKNTPDASGCLNTPTMVSGGRAMLGKKPSRRISCNPREHKNTAFSSAFASIAPRGAGDVSQRQALEVDQHIFRLSAEIGLLLLGCFARVKGVEWPVYVSRGSLSL